MMYPLPAAIFWPAGLSQIVRNMADGFSEDHAERRQFVLGRYVYQVVLNWALNMSASIADLECLSSLIKRHRATGRPPDFATMAAKGFH